MNSSGYAQVAVDLAYWHLRTLSLLDYFEIVAFNNTIYTLSGNSTLQQLTYDMNVNNITNNFLLNGSMFNGSRTNYTAGFEAAFTIFNNPTT